MSNTTLILHVKGTEQETTSLPKQVVRNAISEGKITHSQLIWSPADQAWKQVRELPHLLPSQKLAPAPMARTTTGDLPKVVAAAPTQTGTVPRVVMVATPKVRVVPQAQVSGPPRVKVAAVQAQAPYVVAQARPVAATRSLVVEEKQAFHPFKWICLVLGVFILLAFVVNYLLVDRPLVSHLGKTACSGTTVYAHLGGFVQPNVLVIHIPHTPALTEANLTDFLVALAQSTPQEPLSSNLYDHVDLTSGLMGQYSFSGYAWKQFGDMAQDDAAQRKEFLLDQMGDASGESLAPGGSTLSDAALQARRDKVWAAFTAQFVQP